MPYEITFTKSFKVVDPSIYINECCWGGDIIRDELQPIIANKYQDLMTAQEDWGWFIWFRRGPAKLAVDIFCDDSIRGSFRIRLTSRYKKLLIFHSIQDKAELDELRNVVAEALTNWVELSGLNAWASIFLTHRLPSDTRRVTAHTQAFLPSV